MTLDLHFTSRHVCCLSTECSARGRIDTCIYYIVIICLLLTPSMHSFIHATNRIDAVASRIETAVRMNSVSGAMKSVVKGMDKGLAAMNPEEISKIMDKFEQQFEDLDVKAEYMEGAMNATTATSTPAEQVDELIMMVADDNNLQLGSAFSEMAPVNKLQEPEKPKAEADDLEARLANLR